MSQGAPRLDKAYLNPVERRKKGQIKEVKFCAVAPSLLHMCPKTCVIDPVHCRLEAAYSLKRTKDTQRLKNPVG